MRSQLISAAVVVLTTAFLLPQQAFAQTNQRSPSATVVGGGVAPPEQVPDLVPISYSLVPAAAAVSSVQQPRQTQLNPEGEQQPRQRLSEPAEQEPELANRKAWAKWHGMQRDAMRWEMAYFALSAVDAAQTIRCMQDHTCTELNPIYGRRPSAARVILTKLAGGALQFWLVQGMIKKNPWEARLTAQLSAGIQGLVVGINFSGVLKDY